MKLAIIWLLLLCGTVTSVLAIQGSVDGYISPASNQYKIGDKWAVKVILNSGAGKLSVANISLLVDTTKVRVNSVVVNRAMWNGVFIENELNGVITMYGTSSKSSNELPAGIVELATLNLEAIGAGNPNITLKSAEITGPSNNNDYGYQLNWQNASIVIDQAVLPTVVVATPTIIKGNGIDGVLKFKTTMAGVTANSLCAGNDPVTVTVLKDGVSKTFNNVKLVENGEVNGLKVFEGQLTLTGVAPANNLAVFIKGSRHLQVKYGQSGQDYFYNQQGGNVTVTNNGLTTPTNDFTQYPMMAGDVANISGGGSDGVVDGLDFSFVKTEVNKRLEGDNMLSDLNGNCKLESQDLTLLMLAMKEKQEQLY